MQRTATRFLVFVLLCFEVTRSQDSVIPQTQGNSQFVVENPNEFYHSVDDSSPNKTIFNVTVEITSQESTGDYYSSEIWNLHINNGETLQENESVYSGKSLSSPINIAKNLPDIRVSMLNCINQVRSVEGEKAADMNMLVWDYTIEGYATNTAQKICSSGVVSSSPSNWPYKGGDGELIATSPILINADSRILQDKVCDLVQQWNNTSSFLPKSADFTNTFKWDIGESFKLAEPYLQLALSKTTLVGCSFQTNCHENVGTVVVCQFSDKPDPERPPYAHIYKSLNLTEPQRQPCGRCGPGAKCCFQNMCVGRDIGSSCPKCAFSEPIETNNDDISLCLDKYYQTCANSNCPEACIDKHQIPSEMLVNQCLCTSKQLIEDMILFEQLPTDPQMSYTEGWKRRKVYQHGLCRNVKGETQKIDIPDVGSKNEETTESEVLGVIAFSSETIRANVIKALNNVRSSQLAADMAMIMYDFNLEGYSRLRAKQICEADDKLVEFLEINGTYPPYTRWPHKGGPGETVFTFNETVAIPDDVDNQELANIQLGAKDPLELVEEAVEGWYSEGKTFDFHNLTNNIGKYFYNFRMVVRAEATAAGCSMVTNCKSRDIKTVFVCQYNYPNFKEPVHIKEAILRRKLVDSKYLEFDVPYLHIEADPFLLLQQRRPCGRCRRGSTCCENNLCVGIDISQSSVTFVPPILENHQTGGCRSAFVRHCSQLNCQVNCLDPNKSYLAHQCFCVSPENANKLAFANPEALELNNTLIEQLYERDSSSNETRALLIDGVSTPHPIATYGYIFGLVNSHGLCLKVPGYQEDYGSTVMDSIEVNMTTNLDRKEFSVDSENEVLLSDVFIDLPEDDSSLQKDLTDKFRQEFLLAINSFRSIVGEFATNMNKLAYDFTLEGVAKSSAKQCQVSSLNRYFEINGVPPLTYLSPANETLLPNNVASIVAGWAKPLVSATGNIETSTFLDNINKLGLSLPHSAKQLFSAHATSVGCSVFSNCPEGRYFVVCQFNYLDNSSHPFKPTEDGLSVPKPPCSCCGSEATCCENNLCVGGNSVGQDFSVCNDISANRNEGGRLCSKEFYRSCKDLNCKGQCLKPLSDRDPFFEHYIFNQCTCSKKKNGSSPQAGLLEDGKALIRGICTNVNTTRLDHPGLLASHDNLLDLELFTNGRNGNAVSQILSSALQGELKDKLTVLDSRPFLYALNKQRSRVGERAANINMLKWDYSLEGYAQNWAMVCLAGTNNTSPNEYPYRGGESEVVYSSEIGEEYDEQISPLRIVESWFSGEEIYERNNGTVTITPRIMDFLTVSQASATSVGCSVVKGCPNSGFVVVCQFDSGVNLSKYPYLKISADNSEILPLSQAHPCGKCFSGSTCCNANLCVGLNQNTNRFATPLITKLSPRDNCIPSISKRCGSGMCSESCIPQITADESGKIPLYSKDNTIQFAINQCQCTPKDFSGLPTEAWKIGVVRRNGQCEKVRGYNVDVAKTQNHYIKTVTKGSKGEIGEVVQNEEPESDDHLRHIFSKRCIEEAKTNGLLPKCIVNPMNCSVKTVCYSYPYREDCFCDGNHLKECETIKLCREELPDIVKSVVPNCIGKNILSDKCPCSRNIFSLECSCLAFPEYPGCPCNKDGGSLVCQDLLRNSEASQQKILMALSEISRASKTLRG